MAATARELWNSNLPMTAGELAEVLGLSDRHMRRVIIDARLVSTTSRRPHRYYPKDVGRVVLGTWGPIVADTTTDAA